MDRIYLDYAATTPVDKRVIEEMLPYFDGNFGNPSSAYLFGQKAEATLEHAKERISNLFNASDHNVIFTSGGSESDNLALRGIAFAERKKRGADTILISAVEHDAIVKTALQLEKEFGFKLEILRVDNNGSLDLDNLNKLVNQKTVIVSVIYANNEIGTINPVKEIARICHQKGVPFHTDAIQAVAHLRIDLQELDVDLFSISAHKFYGPKGSGALLKKKSMHILPQITGGPQQTGFRAGTENVPFMVGLVKAYELKQAIIEEEFKRILSLRDKVVKEILARVPGSQLTGHPTQRLPNHASFVFSEVNGNELLMALDMAGFAVSSGSACKVGNPQPSEVLLALGIDKKLAMGSLRVTLGRMTTEEDVDKFINTLPIVIEKIRHG